MVNWPSYYDGTVRSDAPSTINAGGTDGGFRRGNACSEHAPQYTLRIKDWRTDAATAADAFTFKLPAGAKKVDFKELADEDEVPAGFAR